MVNRAEISEFTLNSNFARFSPKLLQVVEIRIGDVVGSLRQNVSCLWQLPRWLH
jgi:hypothetical protein